MSTCLICTRAVTALLLATASLHAQERCGPDDAGPWWPSFVQESWRDVPPAERPIITANQLAAEAIVKKTAYGTPRGFAVMPLRNFGGEPAAGEVRWYAYGVFGAWLCSKYAEHSPDLRVIFNPHPMDWSESDRPLLDENGDGLFAERARSEPLFGSTTTFGRFHEINSLGIALLFTVNGESPTIPVTREEYLKALMFTVEGKNGALVAEATTVRRKEYQDWLARAADRKKENEQILAMLATQNPSTVAKTRAEFEKVEKGQGEFLRMLADQERDEGAAKIASALGTYRTRLAAMNPQQRATPAWMIGDDFVAPGTPNANAITRYNPAFYRTRKSPSEVRAILVIVPNVQDEVSEQHARMFRAFDWEALKRLLAK